jgi:TldD protein
VIRRAAGAVGLVAAAAALLAPLGAAAETRKPAPGATAGPSTAVTDKVVDGIAQEMERSMASLRISGAVAPYFMGYKLTEVEVSDASASLGSVIDDKERHFVSLEAHVHVGDYKFDNSNFIASGREGLDGTADLQLPLEPNPALARRTAWLVTDAAYKEALQQLNAKQEALRGGAAGDLGEQASYAKVKSQADAEVKPVLAREPLEALKARAEKISAVFRGEPQIRDSRVAFTSYVERRWYVNSEGNSVEDIRRASGLVIVASSQAADGQELALTYARYGQTAADLPDDAELTRAAKDMAKTLDDLRRVPLIEPYTGPVLFEGDGAVGIVRYTLAPLLSGTPPPLGLAGRDAERYGGGLGDRLGLRVASPLLTVVDDPTAERADGQSLIGTYHFDDEGVPAQRVEVIQGGTLKSLLMSRTPSKKIAASNGHARLSLPGGIYRGTATNLLISARGGLARKALVARLLAEAKAQGLPYALIIRQLDDPAMTANSELTRFERLQLIQGVDEQAPPASLLAYRVYPGGREELVRGAQLKEVPLRAWRDVIAASKARTVRNYLASTDNPLFVQIAGAGSGFVPSAGVESAIATPDLLFRELDVVPSALGRRPPPALPPP